MTSGEPIDLTGPGSHTLVRQPGLGSVGLGGPGSGADLIVAPDDRIDWSVFDPYTVPAGYPWPRGILYEGADTGFLAWSARRRIETFSWTPTGPVDVDARDARIDRLSLTLRSAPVRMVLPRSLIDLSVAGDLSLLTVEVDDACPGLTVRPDTLPARDAPPLVLPAFPALAACESVDVYVSPLRQPFDCAGLLQFPRLRRVSLSGAATNLAALADLRELRTLRLLYAPDLAALPPLTTWPDLRTVTVGNVEEATGKRLRSEVRALKSTLTMSGVTQLRKPDWFEREYGLPFSQWPTRQARKATAAYRTAQAALASAETAEDVERAVVAFVAVFNALPGMYTIEREDVAEAVCQLADAAPVEIPQTTALGWFDATRDF